MIRALRLLRRVVALRLLLRLRRRVRAARLLLRLLSKGGREPPAPASSSTTSGGRRYKFGPPSLKPLEKLTYEKSDEENAKISKGEVKEFFAKKKPPPEEKIDQVKLQRTLDALTRPPPAPLDDNYVHTLKKTAQEARRSGTTKTDKRRQEQITRGKKFPSSANRRTNRAPR